MHVQVQEQSMMSKEDVLALEQRWQNKYVGPPYCWAEITLAALHAAPWWVTVSMPMGQTGRRTDGWTPDHYITLSGKRGHHNNWIELLQSSWSPSLFGN